MTPEIQAAILGGIFLLVSTLLAIFLPRWLGHHKEERPRKTQEVKAKRQAEDEQLRQEQPAREAKRQAKANSRYTDNGDGTVTDNWSGLVWLKNANCFGEQTWENAKRLVSNLAPIQCDLHDGSSRGDWRLPTKEELEALIDTRYKKNPALSNADVTGQWKEGDAFSGVQAGDDWSSTTGADGSAYAWYVNLNYGNVYSDDEAITYDVWPVRGGD